MSHIPTIRQITLISDSGFEYDEPASVGIPCTDSKGNLYTSSGNKIYKLNNIKDYELIFETGDFHFNSFTFDSNDNIWFSGYNGIAFWNGLELKVYNTNNSELPSDITHGHAIDNAGNVWVTLDFIGLLQISEEEWEIIPNSSIPGLSNYSYLKSPIVDKDNNIWFSVFSPDTNSSILVYNGNEWIYQYPNQSGYGIINIDSQCTIWIINSEYENNSFKKSTLVYLQNDNWSNFDVSMIDKQILTVNANDKKVFIGTGEGLVIIDR
jgi:streptogramin lyase